MMRDMILFPVSVESRKRMARCIVRLRLIAQHDDTPIGDAEALLNGAAAMDEKHGPHNPEWMARETERLRPQINAEMAEQRQYRHRDVAWDGRGVRPSKLAMIAAAMHAATDATKQEPRP